MQYELIQLKNGLKTLFINAPGASSSSIQMWFRAGSALEDKEDEGIAHFLEHMFFKGTKKRPGSAIASEVEGFGGELNAFTSFDYTCYYINSPTTHTGKTVDILMDMVSNPQFKQSDLEPEREVVFEEYRRSIDNPGHYSFNILQNKCFTGGYKHPILGREKTIKNFSRQQLSGFRKNFYNLSNAFFVIGGDLKDKKKIVKQIESYKMPKGPSSEFPKFLLKKSSSVNVHQKEVAMAQLYLVIQCPDFTDQKAAAEDLALNCLGHGETSRLYKKLIMSGSLANSAGASTMFMNHGGAHIMRVSFPYKNIEKVLEGLREIISEVTSEGMEPGEIQKIKNQYIASKVYEMESIESYAFSLGHSYAQTGKVDSEDEFISRIRSTSPRKVNSCLADIFSRAIHTSLQVPKTENKDDALKILKNFQKDIEQIQKGLQKKSASSKTKVVSSKHDPALKLYKIKPGINLLYRQNTMTPTFVFHTYIKGGLSNESEEYNGAYHLISGLLNKGYKEKHFQAIKTDLEDKSASINGFSGKNAYGLTMHGQSEHFDQLTEHFFGGLLHPDFPQDRLDHEKELCLRNLESQKEDPIKICFSKVSELKFKDHPYAYNLLGTEESLERIDRAKLSEIHHSNVNKNEILFTYCGDMEADQVLAKLRDNLGDLSERKEGRILTKEINSVTDENVFIPFEREQTQIFHGLPCGKLGTKENLYLKMLTTHLSGQSSELFVEVRDRQGLCYSAQPVHFNALEAGYWGIYMASGHDKVKPALAAIKDIIERTRKKGLSKSEFNRIKKMIEGQTLINIQTNDDYANVHSVTTLQNFGIDYYFKNLEALRSMDYDDFRTKLSKILGRKWNTVVVGRTSPF